MISLGQCNGGCNVVNDLSTKICVPSETKDKNVKVFHNMIARTNKANTLIKDIFCDCTRKCTSATSN